MNLGVHCTGEVLPRARCMKSHSARNGRGFEMFAETGAKAAPKHVQLLGNSWLREGQALSRYSVQSGAWKHGIAIVSGV